MPDVLDQRMSPASRMKPPPCALPVPVTQPAERPARADLLEQIARLEDELCGLFVSGWPRKGLAAGVAARRGPRLLSLEELEEVRDELVQRLDEARGGLARRARVEERQRRRVEEMLLAPEKHKWVRVSNDDLGEPGCRHWHVRPHWGLLGLLMNWWRVRISSGCPLPMGHRAGRR